MVERYEPDTRVPHWAACQVSPRDIPRRQFRTTAIFDGEHDLGARAKQIVRDARRREAREPVTSRSWSA